MTVINMQISNFDVEGLTCLISQMTYLSTVPLLMCYSIAFAYIKYNQGLVVLPTIGSEHMLIDLYIMLEH